MYFIDPVCKKKIRKKQEAAIIKFRGTVYHFCCMACKESFQRQPQEYMPTEEELEPEPENGVY